MNEPALWELLERRVASTPDRLCMVDERGARMTFAELAAGAAEVAAGLHEIGVRPGHVVAWQLPTWIETVVVFMALSRLDVVQVPLLPIYRAREVGHALRTTDARFLISTTPPAEHPIDALHHIVLDRDSLPRGDAAQLPPAPSDANTVRWIFHTSGTTARPKGACHTDASIIAASASYVDAIGLDHNDRLPINFPIAHVGGLVVQCCSYLAGSANILVERVDPATVIDVLAREHVTLPGVSQVFHLAFMDAQQRRPQQPLFPHARGYTNGGAAKNPELHYRLKELMGAGLYSNYGMTECPFALCTPLSAPDDKRATTEGRPVPGIQVRVVDADEHDVAPGETGELRLKGPMLFAGYVEESLNADAFDAQRFFRTGDLAREDNDGYFQIVGRLKDIIIRKGENISAKELEDLLFGHPAVREVAVVGVPDAATGERCCAVVVAADPSQPLPVDALTAYLREAGLMIQKIPEQWIALDALPRNQVGKVLKNDLRAHVIAQG
ncbi:MAG TPA: AMP-binding protein [Acidimicrobiales bacterium]|nr:AMP-binding protein [Acidimicrobiales bacterium]